MTPADLARFARRIDLLTLPARDQRRLLEEVKRLQEENGRLRRELQKRSAK